jgi:hypothetical protein
MCLRIRRLGVISLAFPVTQRDGVRRPVQSCSADDWLGDMASLLEDGRCLSVPRAPGYLVARSSVTWRAICR